MLGEPILSVLKPHFQAACDEIRSRFVNEYSKIMHVEECRMAESKSQLERFKEAARELGADDDEERFNEKLKKLAKQKPVEKEDED